MRTERRSLIRVEQLEAKLLLSGVHSHTHHPVPAFSGEIRSSGGAFLNLSGEIRGADSVFIPKSNHPQPVTETLKGSGQLENYGAVSASGTRVFTAIPIFSSIKTKPGKIILTIIIPAGGESGQRGSVTLVMRETGSNSSVYNYIQLRGTGNFQGGVNQNNTGTASFSSQLDPSSPRVGHVKGTFVLDLTSNEEL